MIPYGKQDIDADDVAAVVATLKSDWLTQGPAVERFEQAVAAHCDVPYAVAVNSATSALHIACLAAGLQPGDAGWTSPNTFVASANAIAYCGGRPDFVDIDAHDWNLDVELLEQKLRQGAPKLLIPVHFGGLSCAMQRIGQLAEEFGFAVIEDASHAIGARYRGRPVGCCDHADMAVFSFHPVKIVTTGEGGVIVTKRRDLFERLQRLRSHGITRDAALMDAAPDGPWFYQQIELGYNYRMTDIQAALGASQMRRLEPFVERRAALARRYDAALADLPVTRQQHHAAAASAHHLYVVLCREDSDRRRVFERLRAAGIGVNVHYIPVHLQPYYRQLGYAAGDFPEAERYYRRALSLPLYYALSESEQDQVIAALREALS